MCDCVSIQFKLRDEITSTIIEVNVSGTYNGFNFYQWNYLGIDYFLCWNISGQWEVTIGGLGTPAFPFATGWKNSPGPCPPLGSIPQWLPGSTYDEFTTSDCVPVEESCKCGIDVKLANGDAVYNFTINASGNIFNGHDVYQFTEDIGFGLQTYTFYFDGLMWIMADFDGNQFASLNSQDTCPIGDWRFQLKFWSMISVAHDCRGCARIEDRIFREYGAIKLPEIFEEENRGFFRCCCPFNVLASPSSDSWKNDITSAWIKLSDPNDTATCYLLKEGVETQYLTTMMPFINEPNAFYWTINWNDVLSLDGAGCYEIKIKYNISGLEVEFTWGIYHLEPFSIQNALTTARLRVRLNSYQEIEGINFTGSNVEDSIRFYGFIGNRQPKTEIDNIIYQNREMQKVIRENLNVYEVITDPTCEAHIRKLTDLYLLSENEMYISDYNAHNHSYRYNDLPVILEDTAEITYFEFSREASLKCTVSDKFKNQRSYY